LRPRKLREQHKGADQEGRASHHVLQLIAGCGDFATRAACNMTCILVSRFRSSPYPAAIFPNFGIDGH
jgi:hypothetical protein